MGNLQIYNEYNSTASAETCVDNLNTYSKNSEGKHVGENIPYNLNSESIPEASTYASNSTTVFDHDANIVFVLTNTQSLSNICVFGDLNTNCTQNVDGNFQFKENSDTNLPIFNSSSLIYLSSTYPFCPSVPQCSPSCSHDSISTHTTRILNDTSSSSMPPFMICKTQPQSSVLLQESIDRQTTTSIPPSCSILDINSSPNTPQTFCLSQFSPPCIFNSDRRAASTNPPQLSEMPSVNSLPMATTKELVVVPPKDKSETDSTALFEQIEFENIRENVNAFSAATTTEADSLEVPLLQINEEETSTSISYEYKINAFESNYRSWNTIIFVTLFWLCIGIIQQVVSSLSSSSSSSKIVVTHNNVSQEQTSNNYSLIGNVFFLSCFTHVLGGALGLVASTCIYTLKYFSLLKVSQPTCWERDYDSHEFVKRNNKHWLYNVWSTRHLMLISCYLLCSRFCWFVAWGTATTTTSFNVTRILLFFFALTISCLFYAKNESLSVLPQLCYMGVVLLSASACLYITSVASSSLSISHVNLIVNWPIGPCGLPSLTSSLFFIPKNDSPSKLITIMQLYIFSTLSGTALGMGIIEVVKNNSVRYFNTQNSYHVFHYNDSAKTIRFLNDNQKDSLIISIFTLIAGGVLGYIAKLKWSTIYIKNFFNVSFIKPFSLEALQLTTMLYLLPLVLKKKKILVAVIIQYQTIVCSVIVASVLLKQVLVPQLICMVFIIVASFHYILYST